VRPNDESKATNLGGHSIVDTNTSKECLAEQARLHQQSTIEGQAEFERE
jgi:hypothetical protein